MWSIVNSYTATKGVRTYTVFYSQPKQNWRYILLFLLVGSGSFFLSSTLSTRSWSGLDFSCSHCNSQTSNCVCACRDQQFSNTPKASNVWNSEELACFILHLQAIHIRAWDVTEKTNWSHIMEASLLYKCWFVFFYRTNFNKQARTPGLLYQYIYIPRETARIFQRCISIASSQQLLSPPGRRRYLLVVSIRAHAHASLSRSVNQFLACWSTTTYLKGILFSIPPSCIFFAYARG
jgi:hypothetical protein